MLETRRPIVIPDVAVDDRFQQGIATPPVRSWIGVPLVVRDRVIGQLAVDKYQPNMYDEADARLVSVFAQQAAVAIQNAQLFEAEQRQRKLAEALRQAGAALNSTLNYEEVLDRILEQVGLVVPHDAASIMLIKDATAYIFRWRGYAQFGDDAYIASTAFNIADVPHLRRHAQNRPAGGDLSRRRLFRMGIQARDGLGQIAMPVRRSRSAAR